MNNNEKSKLIGNGARVSSEVFPHGSARSNAWLVGDFWCGPNKKNLCYVLHEARTLGFLPEIVLQTEYRMVTKTNISDFPYNTSAYRLRLFMRHLGSRVETFVSFVQVQRG